MYDLLFAPIEGDSAEIALDWEVWDSYPSILAACDALAKEVEHDINHIWQKEFAYRIVKHGRF